MARGMKIADLAFLGRVGNQQFVPPQTANLYLWLKPETLSALSDMDPLGVWPNSNGPAHTMTGVGPIYRTNQLNGHAGIQFDGVNDFVNSVSPSVPATTVYTAFIVAKHNSAAGAGTMVQIGNLSGYVLLKNAGSRQITHRAVADLVDSAATTSAELWSAVKTFVPLTRLFINGSNVVITNSGSAMTAPDNLLTLGTFVGVGLWFAGFIFEVMLYDTDLSDADRGLVEAYLKTKYGL